MKKIIVKEFGPPEVMALEEFETPRPGAGEVCVRLLSVGMNHADLMARRGEYLISSGYPPFTPGIEGGGVIEAVGEGVTNRNVGQRVILGADAPRRGDGTYATHYVSPASQTIPAPDGVPDEQLGALWLPYLTAWGCLVWKQKIQPGQFVGIPAASSSVALAAAQIAKREGAIPIGLTTSKKKADRIQSLPESDYAHLILTHDHHHHMRPWLKDLRRIARKPGIRTFFDPVAAGAYLEYEIHALGKRGTIWIYGLLGRPEKVDVTPLIRKYASIRGWYLSELTEDGGPALQEGYAYILDGFQSGAFRQKIARLYSLAEAAKAHRELEAGAHIGKFILRPQQN